MPKHELKASSTLSWSGNFTFDGKTKPLSRKQERACRVKTIN